MLAFSLRFFSFMETGMTDLSAHQCTMSPSQTLINLPSQPSREVWRWWYSHPFQCNQQTAHSQKRQISGTSSFPLINMTLSIQDLISDDSLDLVCITETWLTDITTWSVLAHLNPSGASIHHKAISREEKPLGAVAILFPSKLKSRKISVK